MGRDLAANDPLVAGVFEEADRVLEPILGRTLTSYIFVDRQDPEAVKQAEEDLKQTAITQPAVLSMDTAMCRLLAEFGLEPDMVMGHSLGEYGALVAAGVLPFAEALEAAAARGREMSKVSFGDNGAMAAVMAPADFVVEELKAIAGYVVPANLNARGQVVIGGETAAVEQAMDAFNKKGYQAQRLPVSHAFHTKIVAPAASRFARCSTGSTCGRPGCRSSATSPPTSTPRSPRPSRTCSAARSRRPCSGSRASIGSTPRARAPSSRSARSGPSRASWTTCWPTSTT